jgi:hypothetical protein
MVAGRSFFGSAFRAPHAMNRAFARRFAFIIGIAVILGFAIGGTILQKRSLANYAQARTAVDGDIRRYEAMLVRGEPRARAAAALIAAGAHIDSPHGDIVVTVLRELGAPGQCRSLVGQLHVTIDEHDRVDGWESPQPNAECD